MKATALVSFCLLQMAVGAAADDYQKLLSIYREIAKIFPKYTGRSFNLNEAFLKDLISPVPFSDSNAESGGMYDFIIVGCGTAGSVLLNRLSEVSHWKILALEAGGAETLMSRIPLFSGSLQFTSLNWDYLMDREPNIGRGMWNQQISWPRGKAVGGTSVINSMVYSRGAALDYDNWAREGNPGWAFKDVLPYFLKAEDSKLRHENSHYHNKSGPWSVEQVYQSKLLETFVLAGEEMGYEKFVDYNDGYQFGFSPWQANVYEGRRHSAAGAYVLPVRHRKNMKVVTGAHVTKLLIDQETASTYGVKYVKDGITYTAHCKKEVILSAGAIGTPQILMLSGIGPKRHLESLEIPVIADLPVGSQLYDQVQFLGLNFITRKPLSISPITLLDPLVYKMFLDRGDGPLTLLGGGEGGAFISTNSSHLAPVPDIALSLQANTFNLDFGISIRKQFRIRDEVYKKYWAPLIKVPTFSIWPILLRPKSKGSLRLKSKDPFVWPSMHANYFTDLDDDDMKTIVAGIRFTISLVTESDDFRKYHTRLSKVLVPGCQSHYFNSDSYWECAVKVFSYTAYQPIGTAKMGSPHDPHSVVDKRLRVYEVDRLRVVDCSVIPIPIGSHASATAVMIGEKASDILKEDWDVL